MSLRSLARIAIPALVSVSLAVSALAQTAPATPGASAPQADTPAKPSRRSRSKGDGEAGSKKEPSVGQLAGRERQKKCGAEWRALSASAKTEAGPKWPQFLSKCVKRLKEQRA